MFWENLTKPEQDTYAGLLRKTAPWLAWAATKPNERGPEPECPTDDDWIVLSNLSDKGWEVKP